MTVIFYRRRGYRMIATQRCYILEFARSPRILKEPVQLNGGRQLAVGDKVVRIGSEKHSAGFSSIRMLPDHALEFIGQFKGGGETFVLFKDGQIPRFDGRSVGYFAFIVMAGGDFFFSTPAVAGRRIDTRNVSLMQ
jgi:hypothetical protein